MRFAWPPTSKLAEKRLEAVKFVVQIISGIAVPIALFLLAWQMAGHDRADREAIAAREQRDREAGLILNVGPYLFESDTRKVQFGIQILENFPNLPKPLIQKLLALTNSTNPQVAEDARQALGNSQSLSEIRAAAGGDPALSQPASELIDNDRWMVYIASGTNVEALNRMRDEANANFNGKKLSLTAKVVPPGPKAPSMFGLVVGDNVPLEEATSLRAQARLGGFSGAYIIRSPGARR